MRPSRLRRWLRLSWTERALLIEAGASLVRAKLSLRTTPFAQLAPDLGEPAIESPATSSAREQTTARQVTWAVRAAAGLRPKTFVCLPQAIAAARMLRRRGVASTTYLGVQRSDGVAFTAHAWLRVGNEVLTGLAESRRHTVVATFGSDPAK